MNKTNFPAVLAKSPTDALKVLGIDEGAILEYNPASGMYVISSEEEEIGPGESYSYFAEAVGFSKKVIDSLIETGALEVLLETESEDDEKKAEEPEVDVWDKADLTMICGRCGTEEKVTEAIGGATLFMPTTSQAETRLVCTTCGNVMSLVYRNGAMMTEEEKAELKAKQEEAKKQREAEGNKMAEQDPIADESELKEKQDEPQKESD